MEYAALWVTFSACALLCIGLLVVQEYAAPTWSGKIEALGTKVCTLAVQFVRKAFKEKADPAGVKRLIGMLFQACDATQQLPCSNQQAITTDLIQVKPVISATLNKQTDGFL